MFIEGANIRADVTNPSETNSAAFTSDYIDTSPTFGIWGTGYLNGKPNTSSTSRFTSINGRHTNGANYIFCDGHVKFEQGSQVSMGQTQGNSQCNQDGQNTPSTVGGCEVDSSGYPLTGQHLGYAAGTDGYFADGVTTVAATSSPI
jgi:prepilin-type processing-associated H-X9-DG protein